jgi:ferredoxin
MKGRKFTTWTGKHLDPRAEEPHADASAAPRASREGDALYLFLPFYTFPMWSKTSREYLECGRCRASLQPTSPYAIALSLALPRKDELVWTALLLCHGCKSPYDKCPVSGLHHIYYPKITRVNTALVHAMRNAWIKCSPPEKHPPNTCYVCQKSSSPTAAGGGSGGTLVKGGYLAAAGGGKGGGKGGSPIQGALCMECRPAFQWLKEHAPGDVVYQCFPRLPPMDRLLAWSEQVTRSLVASAQPAGRGKDECIWNLWWVLAQGGSIKLPPEHLAKWRTCAYLLTPGLRQSL